MHDRMVRPIPCGERLGIVTVTSETSARHVCPANLGKARHLQSTFVTLCSLVNPSNLGPHEESPTTLLFVGMRS